MNFPTREELKNGVPSLPNYYDAIVTQAQSIDTEKLDFKNVDFKPRAEIVEKQRTYFWIRLYLKEETNLSPDQEITLEYIPSGEKLSTTFVCYAKKGLNKDLDEQVVNYNSEDDKKCLCLMIDTDRINVNSDDIPFIRTLFKIGRWWQPQVIRLGELVFRDASGNQLDYYDMEF
jgi:hypothetical protein